MDLPVVFVMSGVAIITMIQLRDLPWALAGLGSIAAMTADGCMRLVLVNDSCSEGTAERLRQTVKGDVIIAGRNLGVAGGRNRLVRAAAERGADYVLSLDDDLLLPPDFTEILCSEFNRLKAAGANPGIVTPATLNYHAVKDRIYGKQAIAALDKGEARMTPKTRDLVQRVGSIGVEDIYHMGIRDWRGGYCFTDTMQDCRIREIFGAPSPHYPGGKANLKRDPEAGKMIERGAGPVEIDTAPGGVCFYPIQLFKEVGGICESFNPFGYEDADFALRARELGYRHFCIPRAVAVHDIAGRLTARPRAILAATQGKMIGAFASHHFKGRERVAATLCVMRRIANSLSASDLLSSEVEARFISLHRLEALLAFIGNALLFMLPEKWDGGVPSLADCAKRTEALAAMGPVDGGSAFEFEAKAEKEGTLVRFSNLRITAPKDLTPPVIASLSMRHVVEMTLEGSLMLSADGRFRLKLDRGIVWKGFSVAGVIEGRRPPRPPNAIAPLDIQDATLNITNLGALPKVIDTLAGMERQASSAYLQALADVYEPKMGRALFDWLRGATETIKVEFSGVLDGVPKALSLAVEVEDVPKQMVKVDHTASAQEINASREDWAMKESIPRRVLRMLEEDPKVAPFPNAYNPSAPLKFARKLRYIAASKGAALTANESRLLKFRNYASGKRAFIIGNGPSLNRLDLTLMKDECTFGVNAIYLNRDKMGFLPTHYVVEDVFVAEDRSSEINALKGPTKWIGNYLRYCLEGGNDVCWLNVACDYREYSGFPHFSPDAARIVWVGGTVSYIAMQLAYYMGFSEVYLVGFDHSYTVPAEAHVEGRAITSTTDDPNHFHPDYFGKGYRWHDPRVDRMELAYRKARNAFESAGRKIFNATNGGHLETFERVEYASLFARAATMQTRNNA